MNRCDPVLRCLCQRYEAVSGSQSPTDAKTVVLLLASRNTVHDGQRQVLGANAESVAKHHPTRRTTLAQCKAIDPP